MKSAAKILLINAKKQILLHLRDSKPGIASPGLWDLIGGGIEEGETPLEAIKREVKEELGIFANNIKFIKETEVNEKLPVPGTWRVFIFKGDIDAEVNEIKLTEGQRVQYFELDKVPYDKMPLFLKDFMEKDKDSIFN